VNRRSKKATTRGSGRLKRARYRKGDWEGVLRKKDILHRHPPFKSFEQKRKKRLL